jgi:hypothetical protein
MCIQCTIDSNSKAESEIRNVYLGEIVNNDRVSWSWETAHLCDAGRSHYLAYTVQLNS